MVIYLGAGHRGFALKETLKESLTNRGLTVVDCGADTYEPSDDYPDYVQKVTDALGKDMPEHADARGIVICGSGNGVCVAANKASGIRAGLALNLEQVKDSTAHDHLNVLCLSADYTQGDDARAYVDAFLDTPWSDEERHVRRVGKITQAR